MLFNMPGKGTRSEEKECLNFWFLSRRGRDFGMGAKRKKMRKEKYEKYIKFYCFLLSRNAKMKESNDGGRSRRSLRNYSCRARETETERQGELMGRNKTKNDECENQKLFLCTWKFISYHSRWTFLLLSGILLRSRLVLLVRNSRSFLICIQQKL